MSDVPPPPPGNVPPQPVAPLSDADGRLYASLGHAGNILFPAVAPLIVWLIAKDKSAFVDSEGKSALNWGIGLVIGYAIGFVLTFAFGIGVLISLAVWIVSIVFGIKAAVATNKGESATYPFNLNIVK